jgi:hypothetical protein
MDLEKDEPARLQPDQALRQTSYTSPCGGGDAMAWSDSINSLSRNTSRWDAFAKGDDEPLAAQWSRTEDATSAIRSDRSSERRPRAADA